MKKPDLPSRRVVDALGKSEIVVTPTGLGIVEELAARGCSVVTISAAIGVNKETFLHIRRRDPAVEDAFERGRAREHDRLVANLNTAAASGNVVASIFLLRARHGYQSGEGIDVNVNVQTGGVLVIPAEVTVEQYLAQKRAEGDMVDITPVARPALYPGHVLPEAEPAPFAPSRPAPSGTTLAPIPGRTTRGD
ncbi:MAG: hypothetical protein JNN06_03260 [Gemmobacter sp.]|uniref:hypothetical protein n=1 Tax=Gemmobacter sp. TaxID=1898957 RepID=UPI001A5ADE39|nr:hypothetical protein [Gemmobacter sp.]MBL8561277.1 hypothetical protein [Gemmobacter sp.]